MDRQSILAEIARRQSMPKITTEEQARTRGEQSENGGLEGGPWYMEAAKDVLDPVGGAVGGATGGIGAAGRGVRGAVSGAVENTLGKAAEKQAMIDMVNKGSELAPYAKNLINQATQSISQNAISPKDAALRQLLQGTKGEVNPDLVANVFPNYAKKLAESASAQGADAPARAELSGEQLLRLKRGADKAAQYSSAQAPFSENAATSNANAKQLADVVRGQIYNNAPGSEEALASMAKDIKLKNFLQKKSNTDPVGLLKTSPGTTKDSLLAAADEAAGTNLRGEGQKIKSAVDLQMNPGNLIKPLEAPTEVKRMAMRGAIKAGDIANSAAGSVGDVADTLAVPEAAGWAGTQAAGRSIQGSEPQADKASMVQQIQQEIARRKGVQ